MWEQVLVIALGSFCALVAFAIFLFLFLVGEDFLKSRASRSSRRPAQDVDLENQRLLNEREELRAEISDLRQLLRLRQVRLRQVPEDGTTTTEEPQPEEEEEAQPEEEPRRTRYDRIDDESV